MFGGHAPILLIYLQLSSGGCDLLCPTINELNTTAELNCFTHNNTAARSYSRSSSGAVATCTAPGTPCFIFQNQYSAKFVNSTHTVLTVISVTSSDAGIWTCTIQGMPQDLCDMEVMKTPRCSIISKEDTNILVQYQQLTLTVDIQDYYCSTALTFSLQTGNVTTLLMEADSVASVTHNTSSVTLNVTDSHLGFAGLMFKCHNNKWNLTCDGVTELAVPKTSTCSITGDKDTETLTLNEELTLTVDIAAYFNIRGSYCTVDSNFTLQTGDVTQLLNVAGTGTDRDISPIIFNVTEPHLGGVRLIFNCQHKHWNLTCEGVGELNNKTKTAAVPENDELVTASTPIIIACVFGVILFLIIVVILIVFVVKRKQGKRKVAAGYPSSDETEDQVEDNVVLPNESASGTSQQEPGLRINPVYISAAVVDSLMTTVTTGTFTDTDGDNLHPETRGEYDALDRNAVQPSNIYEYLTTYEQIANM